MNSQTHESPSTPAQPDPLAVIKQNILFFLRSILSEERRKAYYAISIVSGLVIFFIYFSHINYTPRISLTDSVILLFSALIIGVGFSLVMAGLFILPSMVWRDILTKELNGEQGKRFKYLFTRQGIILALMIGLTLCATLYEKYRTYLIISILSIALLGIIILAVKNNELRKNITALLLNSFIMCICTIMLITIAMHGVEDIKDAAIKETTARAFVFASLAAVLLFNVFIASLNDMGFIKTTLSALGLLLAIFVATQSISVIPKGVMHTLGLGSFRAEEIILNNELCDYFKTLNPSNIQSLTQQSCTLKKPWILWKGEDAILIKIEDMKYQIDKKDIKLIAYKTFNT